MILKVTKNRDVNVDLARTLAIILVITTHATEITYGLDNSKFFTTTYEMSISAIILHTFGRLGVPIFLFLTGFLLLNRQYDNDKIKSFWKNNLFGIIISSEIWIVIYYFFSIIYYKKSFQIMDLLMEMIFLKNAEANHLWYLGTIIGLYLFLPFISRIINSIDRKIIIFILTISIFLTFTTPTANVICEVLQIEKYNPVININYYGGWAGILLTIGWLIKNQWFDRFKTKHLLAIGTISVVLQILLEIWANNNLVIYYCWYDSILVVLAALCLTLVILRMKSIRVPSLINWLGYSTFGVYVIHKLVMIIFANYLSTHCNIHYRIQIVLVLVISTFVISEFMVYIFSRSKKMSKVLFFMK